jgi:hypothetical protein
MFKIPKKVPEFVQETAVHITDSWAVPRNDNPMSFGHDFNLIKAVKEYGPQRIDQINKELDKINEQFTHLTYERTQLEKLIQALA